MELLLDATLAEDERTRLDDYYAAMVQLDPEDVQRIINLLATRTSERIGMLVERFHSERFLYDYLDDERLLVRLNHVMRRVNLPLLPAAIAGLFPPMRQRVRERLQELLPKERMTLATAADY
jgi:hypothetical protein